MFRMYRTVLASAVVLIFGLTGCPGGETEPVCEPATCESLDVACGIHDDNCGGLVDCGNCEGCTPRTACEAHEECGTVSDGCEGTLDCGGCDTGYTCSAENTCVEDQQQCTPESDAELCAAASIECGPGTATDRCGDTRNIACGGCATGFTCTAGACVEDEPECIPATCQDLGRECGEYDDGCGGRVTCDPCGQGEICRFDGTCVSQCVPQTCADAGAECGVIRDGCGGTVNCNIEVGGCTGGDVCGGGGPNLCGPDACIPLDCDDLLASDGIQCGTHSDGCEGVVTCGPCAASERCTSTYICEPRCVQTSCEAEGAECGTISDGCGGTLNCDILVGGCTGDDVCGGGGPNLCGEDTCEASTCADLGFQCGSHFDGCGDVLDCDAEIGCATGEVCDAGLCVEAGGADGTPCTADADCQSGFCITEADNGWLDGYCSGACFDDADCTEDAHCAFKDAAGEGFCMATCSGETDCREDGYVCANVDGTGPSECFAAATGDGEVGDACEGTWDCGGGLYGLCADLWPDGYCLVDCNFTDCPDGSTCLGFGDDAAYCTADCTTHADCRQDYFCADLDGLAHGACIPGCRADAECDTGEACVDGVCVDEAETDVGEPCTADGDCDGDFCFTEDDFGWYQGYCSGDCTADADCGLGNRCSYRDLDGNGICMSACAGDSECRTGYICDPDDTGRSICIPGAGGAGDVGDACDGYWECGGRDLGFCFNEADAGWPDGYCSQVCDAETDCPTGAECVTVPDGEGGTFSFCVAECDAANECRTGYECIDIDVDICWPEDDGEEPVESSVGEACEQDADCEGEVAGCIDEANSGWYLGYCTALCETDADCGAGAHCGDQDTDGVGYCFRGCQTDGDCRTGYECTDLTGDGQDECAPLPWSTGTGDVGDACLGYFECGGGDFGDCLSEHMTGFPGGYCSVYCGDGGTTCPGGSVCIGSWCWQSCTSDTECRQAEGYVCDAEDTCFPDL